MLQATNSPHPFFGRPRQRGRGSGVRHYTAGDIVRLTFFLCVLASPSFGISAGDPDSRYFPRQLYKETSGTFRVVHQRHRVLRR